MSLKILIIAFWNKDGVVLSPKGKTVHCYWAVGIQKAVLGLSIYLILSRLLSQVLVLGLLWMTSLHQSGEIDLLSSKLG